MRIFEFKRDKFRELVLYIANEAVDDPTFGAVKLNKILWYADFEAYATLGVPITGARYQRLEFGPAAVALRPIQDELIRFGEARLDPIEYHGKRQVRLTPERKADLGLFTKQELELVDRAIKTFWRLNATAMSQLSHLDSKGWQIVQDGQDIPYESAFLSTEPPSAEAIEYGQQLARELGLLVEQP